MVWSGIYNHIAIIEYFIHKRKYFFIKIFYNLITNEICRQKRENDI